MYLVRIYPRIKFIALTVRKEKDQHTVITALEAVVRFLTWQYKSFHCFHSGGFCQKLTIYFSLFKSERGKI